MKIKINDTELEIFSGARVKDALLKYSQPLYEAALQGKPVVTDRWQNILDPDGALSENQHLLVKTSDHTNTSS